MENVSKNVEGLGLRIAQSRTKLGLSQSHISDLIGMPRPNYTAIENSVNGRFLKDYQLKNIAINLNVSSDYLLGLISDPNPNADIMAMVNSLGLSSKAIYYIKNLKSKYDKSELLVLDSLIQSLSSDFYKKINLYKKVKIFFDTRYTFVLEFEKDISGNQIDFYNSVSIDFSAIQSKYRYYYFNLEDAEKYFKTRRKIIEECNYDYSKVYSKLEVLFDSGEYTDEYIYLYQDKSKLKNFKDTLETIKKILHDLMMILDFDETGLIFSIYEKEQEAAKIIDKIIIKVEEESLETIDNLIIDLSSSLSFFTETINSSLNFIKYKINDELNNFLEKELFL